MLVLSDGTVYKSLSNKMLICMFFNLLRNNFILGLFFLTHPPPLQIYFPESEPLTKSDKKVLDSFFCSKYFKCSS